MNKRVLVFGHKNPDTDSIVSAICYAEYKRLLGEDGVQACRAGHLNAQTAFILQKFSTPAPLYIPSLEPIVQFYTSGDYCAISSTCSVWDALHDYDLVAKRALAVVDERGCYKALVHYSALATAFVEILSGQSAVTSQNYIDERLLRTTPILKMADKNIATVKPNTPIAAVRHLMSTSPIRRLPVLDDNGIILALISEHDITSKANIEVIMVDHNEKAQAVDGIENYTILEVLDHHKIAPFPSGEPMLFMNIPVGSTSTIVATRFFDTNIALSKRIASLLLCGILSDTLILQSPTTTDIDRSVAKRLAEIASLDIAKLGQEILSAGSVIRGKSDAELVNIDKKEYINGKATYTISQIEVSSTKEALDRREGILNALASLRQSQNNLFCALLVTDVITLNSIMMLSAENSFESIITLPKLSDGVYYLKGIVSRKKQVVPLLSEVIKEFIGSK